MSYIMPFGKYSGDTLAIIRMNDLQYIQWLAKLPPNGYSKEAIEKCKQCIEYLNTVDPFALN